MGSNTRLVLRTDAAPFNALTRAGPPLGHADRRHRPARRTGERPVTGACCRHGWATSPPGRSSSRSVSGCGLYGVALLLAVVWAGSNIRRVPPDSSAVVFRLGRIVRVQQAGLLLALPPPLERVALLPGPARQMRRVVAALPRSPAVWRPTTPGPWACRRWAPRAPT